MHSNTATSFIPLRPRDPHESHRAASPLELFFDLVFVVAVSFSSQQLHHLAAEGHIGSGVLGYLMVFFAIWWAWMNFTWFASAFDTDDWLYRVLTIVQMAGVLMLAAGAADAMQYQDFTLVTIGYVIMRLALVVQWLRAAAGDPTLRQTAARYAAGITIVQILWVARLFLPEQIGFIAFFVLAAAEIAVPIWAEARRRTPWHPEHIAERYSLFTLILLGESILASANAVVEAVDEGHHVPDLLTVSAAGLVIAAGMWWIYFSREQHDQLTDLPSALTFGYSHYVIFAAAGAFSAGVELVIDSAAGHAETSSVVATGLLAAPVAIFILGIWMLSLRRRMRPAANGALVAGAVVVLVGMLLPPLAAVVVAAVGVAVAVAAVQVPMPAHRP
ncbi:low temperature requirement protein A [Pseudoclavibacter sp. CFCC 11306]|uniref:low temperature requirement protein A n=1 Tax=Pseudoclavibacter sp. CFCC 11306 TaxID=1564493 RepID=UPI0013012D4C|nr:low temperature requirement protein A [Pseudoclavibacter sp. CFCC 11306]KAB1658873.1 low temperature requirement protein A [Pseudoclavibacter sp. CFCC 11306]